MNNAFILENILQEDEAQDAKIQEKLRSEESRLVKIIEALRGVQTTKEWKTLKAEIFDNLVNTLEKDLLNEANQIEADSRKLNRLAGELKWANRYADLSKLENHYKGQLQAIRTKLYGKEKE